MESSNLAKIAEYPAHPIDLFEQLLGAVDQNYLVMNLATIDDEFGVLNRSVMFRGLIDGCITFVTERNSRKYQNIQLNPKVSVTFYLPALPSFENTPEGKVGAEYYWQVRLFDATAIELDAEQIAQFWTETPLVAKIRSHICVCGQPVQPKDLQERHDELLQDYRDGLHQLQQTETYTAFKIVPKRWDFYKSGENLIGDRLLYKKQDVAEQAAREWEISHVCA